MTANKKRGAVKGDADKIDIGNANVSSDAIDAIDANATGAKKGPKEHFYDKIPLTARQLDIIIIALAALFIVALAVGAFVGNGYLPMLKF